MSEPCLFLIGATHQNAPLEVRERLAIDSEAALRSDLACVRGLRELAVVHTCNRVEFYGVADSHEVAESVQAAFCARQRFAPADFERIRIRLSGRAVAQHLFEVASGLDSQLVGENEIFGQVKEAYAAAQGFGTAGVVLNRVFQKAFQAAKHVRTTTAIAAGRVSVANVAVDLATNIYGSLARTRVLILGTGEIGEGTARAFKSRGAEDLAVAGRTPEHAHAVASCLGAGVVHYDERESRVADFDIVVCSTAAPHTVLSRTAVAAAMRRRPARPLLLIDLALPRDVEAAAADLQNVFLYNLDDLAEIAERNRAAREAEIARCRAILAERAEGVWSRVRDHLAAGGGPQVPKPEAGAAGEAAAP